MARTSFDLAGVAPAISMNRNGFGPPRRLLVFGINFPPEPTGTALNSAGYTQGVAALGWNVTFISGVPHYPAWERGEAPKQSIEDGVNVMRKWHYVPRAQSTLKRGTYEATWLAAALPTVLAKRKVDLILGVIPSVGGAVLAATAAKRYSVPYALLFQDLIGKAATQSGIAGAGRVAGSVRRVETGLARRAERVGIVAEGFRDYFVDAGIDPAKIVRLRNPARLGRALEARDSTRARLGWDRRFVVIHTGSMGYKQGLENLISGAEFLRARPEFHFVLQGDGNQREKLEREVRQRKLENVEFLPVAPADEFPSILRAADVALLNQRASVHNMSLPAKLASYFAAGLPVVAAVASGDETATEVELARAGVIVEPDDPGALAAAVQDLQAHPGACESFGVAGETYAEQHLSIDSAVAAFESFLQSCLPAKVALK